jgi:hypothetical protein
MSDDSGLFTDGTVVDEAFIDDIFDQIDDQAHSVTNPTVKPKATTDEVITARGNLASLNARISGVVDADGNPVPAAGQATETQLARAEANINLMTNGDMEDWTAGGAAAPDDYVLTGAGAVVARTGPAQVDTTDLGTGTYAAKITSGGGAAALLYQYAISPANFSKYRSVIGRKIGFTIRAKVAASNVLRVVVSDGTTATASAYATGSADEQLISVVHPISAAANQIIVYAEVALGTNTAYVSGYAAVFSDIAPAAWTPGWAKFRQDILDEAEPETMRLGGTLKSVRVAGVLLSSVTPVTQTANGSTFYTIAIPAGCLSVDGDRLRVTFHGLSGNEAQNFCVQPSFGGTTVAGTQIGTGVVHRIRQTIVIQRLTATTQMMFVENMEYATVAGTGQPREFDGTPGETLANAINLVIKLSSTGTKTVTLYGYVVEFLPAVA